MFVHACVCVLRKEEIKMINNNVRISFLNVFIIRSVRLVFVPSEFLNFFLIVIIYYNNDQISVTHANNYFEIVDSVI